MVGIVERMSDSLGLIQSVIDADLEMTEYLKQLDTTTTTRTSTTTSSNHQRQTPKMVRNKSALSTSTIVRHLQDDDDEFYAMLCDFLRYEFQLYDFALELHAKQVQRLREEHGNRYSHFLGT